MQVCDTCDVYKRHGKKCWFYWENKKSCSQYHEALDEEPHFKSVL